MHRIIAKPTTNSNIFQRQAYTNTMKIVFCGGGSAGHVTPNLALVDLLPDAECYYIGSEADKRFVQAYMQNGKLREFYHIDAPKLQRKLTAQNLLLPIRFIKSARQAKAILTRIAPDAVFSKGGYVGLPVVVASKRLKIPAFAHESDTSLGLANRLSARCVVKLLSAFPLKNAEEVGAIVRKDTFCGNRQRGLATMGFDGRKPVLLVIGGSLGAQSLNKTIAECSTQLSDTFDVFVITGAGKAIQCDRIHQTEFVQNVGDVIAAADVCVTRAGSNTLAELTLAQVPFVAVPLANCSRGEQLQNAKLLADWQCGIMLNDDDTLPQRLPSAIMTVYNNRAAITAKQRAHANLYGSQRVADMLRAFCQRSND